MTYFWASVKDWKTWAFALVYMGSDMCLYGFSLFLPTIIRSEYSMNLESRTLTRVQGCLSQLDEYGGQSSFRAPLRCCGCSHNPRRLGRRPYAAKRLDQHVGIIARRCGIQHAGWLVRSACQVRWYDAHSRHTCSSVELMFLGTFLGALGIYPNIPNTITWAANNVEGVYKRGVTLGFVIGWGNLNGTKLPNT